MKQKKMLEQPKQKRNYLLLGASLLIVGLVIEYLRHKVLGVNLGTVYKTLLIMFMIGAGYSFASGILAPFAARSLKALQRPFVKGFGPNAGKVLFYIVIYAALFGLYLFVFIYGMRMPKLF